MSLVGTPYGLVCTLYRVDDRHVRLEREFEADRARKDRERDKERRRDRKLCEDIMRQVHAAEDQAARDRTRRQQRLAEMRDRRQHQLKQARPHRPPSRSILYQH